MNIHPDETPVFEAIADGLADPGIIILPNFLTETEVTELRGAALALKSDGLFRQAGIGHNQGATVDTTVRGDHILWLRDIPTEKIPASVSKISERLERLIGFVNQALYTGIRSHELHFALYPMGMGYQRHLDVFRDDSARTLTFICYLNPADWTDADGGHLRIFRPENPETPWPFATDTHDVLPAGGTLIMFRSPLYPHEVMPSTRMRASLTGWFRRD